MCEYIVNLSIPVILQSQVNNLYIRLISQSINATAIFYFLKKLLHNLSISLRYKGLLVVTVINIIKVLLYKYYYHDYWGGWCFAIYTVQVVISDSMDTVDSLAGVNSYL